MAMPAWITLLLRDGRITPGSVGSTGQAALNQLLALGIVAEEPQGKRRQIVVRDVAALTTWASGAYHQPVAPPTAGQRAGNIARTRDSKGGRSTHDRQPLLLRWFDPRPNILFADLTQRWGIVAVTTDTVSSVEMPDAWNLLTVENWESFAAATYAAVTGAVVVVYTGGQPADRVLRALAELRPRPRRALHFGDYDWSGVAIYRRIRAVLPQCELYVPASIEVLFEQFRNAAVLVGQTPLVQHPGDSQEVVRVLSLIQRFNAGLEQEIVAVPSLAYSDDQRAHSP